MTFHQWKASTKIQGSIFQCSESFFGLNQRKWAEPFMRQPKIMVKHTQAICQQIVGLTLNGLIWYLYVLRI